SSDDVNVHSVYVAQQHLDALANRVSNAIKQKVSFDKHVLGSMMGEVTFAPGQLVQTYVSELDQMFQTSHKILPRWSAPCRVINR
ncbi:hypothetical protein BDR06DRAFT_844070, partial [Suillus hirtellus]